MKNELIDKASEVVGAAGHAVAELSEEGRAVLARRGVLPARRRGRGGGARRARRMSLMLVAVAGIAAALTAWRAACRRGSDGIVEMAPSTRAGGDASGAGDVMPAVGAV